METPKGFIFVHCVHSTPGNPVVGMYHRVRDISTFGEIRPEYATIGAACAVTDHLGQMFLTKEGVDDVRDMIARAQMDE